jgi:hypothetical protein
LAASIFHFGEHTIAEAKDELTRAGLIVRPFYGHTPESSVAAGCR